MTLDKLAQMSQGEFLSIHEEMKSGFDKVNEDARILRRDMETGFGELGSGMKEIMTKLDDISERCYRNP